MTTKTKVKSKVVQAVDNISRLKSLIEEGGKIEIEIAFLAREIYYTEEYRNRGYANFGEFAKAELAMPYRKIMWLLQIGTTCEKINLSKEQLQDSGVEWTKLKELTHLMEDMDATQAKQLLEQAKDMSYQEVEEFVRKHRTKTIGGEKINIETMKFKFVGDQINTINLALGMAQEILGTDNKSQALEYICGEWIQNHQDTVPQAIEKIEQIEEPVVTPKPPRKKRADVLRKEAQMVA